jgi:lipoprotein-anchoring transpeptidase ErfK/SrfK
MGELIEVDIDHHVITVKSGDTVVRTITEFSTGRPKHETPTGNHFKIFKRDIHHVSSSYPVHKDGTRGGAKMPYSQFFAPAVAFHEGDPAVLSHGCVHLSQGDARWLWDWVEKQDEGVAVHVLGRTQTPHKPHPHHVTPHHRPAHPKPHH